jgi:site-specific DNA-methyltransferase (adenine-specific)
MILSEDPRIEFTCEDNMGLMGRYSDKHFDLAIVDPPYGIGFSDYERGSSGIKVKERYTKKGKKEWDSSIPADAYFDLLMVVSKNQIVWGGNYFPILWKQGCKGFIFWDKKQPVPNFASGELAWASFNRPAKCFNYPYYGNINSEDSRAHPTQKPVALYKWLLQNYAKEGDKILDTHVGSGSIMIACWELGFDFVGCELDKEYYDAAVKRFKEHVIAHPKLFTQAQIKNEQLTIL